MNGQLSIRLFPGLVIGIIFLFQPRILSQSQSILVAQSSLDEVRRSLTIDNAFNEAEKRYSSGDCRGAIQLVDQIINLAPNSLRERDQRSGRYYILQAYSKRGYYYYSLGQFKNAISDYNNVISSGAIYGEELIMAFWGKGQSLYKLGSQKSAIQDITQGINLVEMHGNPRYDNRDKELLRLMYTDRGIINHKLGDVVGALDDYNNGLLDYCFEHNKRLAEAKILGEKLQDSDFPRGLKPSMGILTREQCRSIIYGIKKKECRPSYYYPFD